MKYCPNCQRYVKTSTDRCPDCGRKVEEEIRKCPDCLCHYTGEHICPSWIKALKKIKDEKDNKRK